MQPDLFSLEVMIPGAMGDLEGRLLYGSEERTDAGVIICPPHPLLAGNMENNVIQAVARKLAASWPVLLFNYPAVGKSVKPRPELPLFEYWNELDQRKDYGKITEEVKKVIAWSAGYFPRLHLIGYSFGASIALDALSPATLSYTAIAPPLAEHDFTALQTLALPTCLIRAEQDDLLAAPAPTPTADACACTIIKGSNHFFLHQEQLVADRIADFLLSTFPLSKGHAQEGP